MLCTRCKKRQAVVFVQRLENGKPVQEGYCLTCARELHIQPVDDLMKRFNMTDDQLASMEEHMADLMQQAQESGAMMPMMDGDMQNPDDTGDDFVPGGSPVFPFGFGGTPKAEEKGEKSKKQRGRGQRKYLDTYCENLTQKAKDGKLDAIIGRDREVYRTVQILCRRQKNNPCLIGEAGVGKTAIAEGIAQRIAEGKVPARLQDKEIYLLDLTALVAGTQFRGQFEQRVKGLLSEIKAAGNVILFIDEIHNIVGAGDSDGAMNAANIMKPALSRGQIQVIGATTFAEYRKFIEKDSALERRFQPVKVEEPSINDAIAVIRGVKGYYEKYHCVRVPDSIVADVVHLSERYITDRYLPDKAIDLLDESCACCNLRHPEITEFLNLQKQVAELETKEHDLENPDPEKQGDAWVNPQFNEYTLTKLRMVGKGDESSGYKVAFFPPETLDGAEGFLVFYSVREFDEVWEYLSSLTREEILTLDKPANRAYVMTDLSYCDGVGNTLNTAQKDLITGDDFTEPGTHYFYAAVFGADGLLSLEKAAHRFHRAERRKAELHARGQRPDRHFCKRYRR